MMNSQDSDIKCSSQQLHQPMQPTSQAQLNQQPIQKHKTHRHKSIFPQKLWHLVNNSQLDSAIRWTLDGRSFLVFENQFRNLCLGKENKFFYTTQAKSFVRQLHLYGFRKVNKNQFLHPNFKRDHPELLSNIRRTYKQSCLSSTNDIKQVLDDQTDSQQQQQLIDGDWYDNSDRNNLQSPLAHKRIGADKTSVTSEHRYSTCRTESQSSHHFRDTLTELVASNDRNPFGSISNNTELLSSIHTSTSSMGALVFPSNNYGEDEGPYALNPLAWYDANYADINYNYNEGLSLYNSDVYPSSSCEDNNNITL